MNWITWTMSRTAMIATLNFKGRERIKNEWFGRSFRLDKKTE